MSCEGIYFYVDTTNILAISPFNRFIETIKVCGFEMIVKASYDTQENVVCESLTNRAF